MTTILKVLDDHALTSITQVLLELDFFGKGSGAARTRINPPALRTPPQFKIVPTERYVTPIPNRAQNWFYKGTEVYKRNVANWRASLSDLHRRLLPHQLLTIIRNTAGDSGIYRLSLTGQVSGQPLFSDAALRAVRLATHDGDDSQLLQIYDPEQAEGIICRRDIGRSPAVSHGIANFNLN